MQARAGSAPQHAVILSAGICAQAAFIMRPGVALARQVPQPDMVGHELQEVASQIIAKGK